MIKFGSRKIVLHLYNKLSSNVILKAISILAVYKVQEKKLDVSIGFPYERFLHSNIILQLIQTQKYYIFEPVVELLSKMTGALDLINLSHCNTLMHAGAKF